MSHIHIPDGVLATWLVFAGWIACALLLYICIRKVREVELSRKIPLLGVVSAIMIVGMTLEIVPIAYHINMAVIAGIVLGPALGFISAFIVDLVISMFGHGGITVVGLNTLVVGAEAAAGYYLFQGVSGILGSAYSGWAAGFAAVFSLLLSTSIMIGIVYTSQVNPGRIAHEKMESVQNQKANDSQADSATRSSEINIERFSKTVIFFGALGWLLEAAVTGLVVKYVARVRPDLMPAASTSGS